MLSFHQRLKNGEFIELAALKTVRVDLRYSSTNNFLGEDVYDGLKTAYLHRIAFEKLSHVDKRIRNEFPDLRLLVFDALRPRSAQWKLWKRVENTPEQKYIGNPETGSIHNFGFAIDLSLCTETGEELDMGTPFDTFSELAEPQHEERLLRENRLTEFQLKNRRLLRELMFQAGFHGISHEWWHFEALPRSTVRSEFSIVETIP